MGSQARGYIRIYMGLFDNSIYFSDKTDRMLIGDALLEFIYTDFKSLADNRVFSAADFEGAHPFFRLCDPRWMTEFIGHLNDPASFSYMPDINDMISLQDKYTSLLLKLYNHSSGYDEQYLIDSFKDDEGINNTSCFARISLDIDDNNKDDPCTEEYFVSSLDECLFIEFMEVLKRHIVIKICKNCGRMFIPKRTNMDYCSRVYTADGKTCSDVGYTQTFARNVKNDELLQAYTRAYKAHYARMTKPRKRMANMTREEFEAWYIEAKNKLEQARSGLLDAEEFKTWLKQ